MRLLSRKEAKFTSPTLLPSKAMQDISTQNGVTLALGKQEVETLMLLQQGAPNNVLLVTDVVSRMGISPVVECGDGESMDLLRSDGEKDLPKEGTADQAQPNNQEMASWTRGPPTTTLSGPGTGTGAQTPTGEIHLLSAVKIPAGHLKLVCG